MTHADLVKRAARWLRTTVGCGVVLTEHHGDRETPDAIGWRGAFSHLVECKISRADFWADQQTPTRRFGAASRPALHCWYLTPPGLLTAADLPEAWGLLEAQPRIVRRAVEAAPLDGIDNRTPEQLRAELRRLYLEVRRYKAQGLTYQTRADFLRSQRMLASRLPLVSNVEAEA